MKTTKAGPRCIRTLASVLALFAMATDVALANTETNSDWWGSATQTATSIAENGRWDVYLSGYAHHSRETYSDDRVRKLNEHAWGFGLGKTIRNEQGNDESLYALVIRDSHKNPQWSAGYAYQWIFPLGGSGIEAGAGISAQLMRRDDWFKGWPFPAVLPVFSLGTREAKLMATYVPRISTRKGKGDVVLLFAKLQW